MSAFNLQQVIDAIEDFAPLSLQGEYDNCGLKVGSREAIVTGVLVTLDTTTAVVKEAVEKGCNVIVEHHPSIFRPIKSLDYSLPTIQALTLAIKNDIAVYSAHTNVDFTQNGLNDFVAQRMGLTNIFTVDGRADAARIGRLPRSKSIGQFADELKIIFGDKNITTIGDKNKEISVVGVINGGGGGSISEILDAKQAGAEIFVTGDVKYAVARFAKDINYGIISIGHFESEILFPELVKSVLEKRLPKLFILSAEKCENPYNY